MEVEIELEGIVDGYVIPEFEGDFGLIELFFRFHVSDL